MIDEKAALVILEGEVLSEHEASWYLPELKCAIKKFAKNSIELFNKGRITRFKEDLKVAMEFYTFGNQFVRNAVVVIYLQMLSEILDSHQLSVMIVKALPKQLKHGCLPSMYSQTYA